MPDKGGFPHFMIKEIFEQPQGMRDTIEPRLSLNEGVVRLDDIRISPDELRALRRINIVASGTSRHAGMVGQYVIQDMVNIPVDVDYASEFEYRNPLIGPGEITIVITQSGETADTTAAQREAKAKGSRTVAISNVIDSTIAREADGVLYTLAGPEISIASTKAFCSDGSAVPVRPLPGPGARQVLPRAAPLVSERPAGDPGETESPAGNRVAVRKSGRPLSRL
jgi:glucosamine--fructose-6-phosphate aminotransferase (isomerizing)